MGFVQHIIEKERIYTGRTGREDWTKLRLFITGRNANLYTADIVEDALKEAQRIGASCGDIEVRQFNTEIRNQLVICGDDKETCAWMSILLPPLPAVECRMIEYSEPGDCVAYYDLIWDRAERREI